jgi:hypothetical protein
VDALPPLDERLAAMTVERDRFRNQYETASTRVGYLERMLDPAYEVLLRRCSELVAAQAKGGHKDVDHAQAMLNVAAAAVAKVRR